MTNRDTYLHLCFFSNVCNISVKLLGEGGGGGGGGGTKRENV